MARSSLKLKGEGNKPPEGGRAMVRNSLEPAETRWVGSAWFSLAAVPQLVGKILAVL